MFLIWVLLPINLISICVISNLTVCVNTVDSCIRKFYLKLMFQYGTQANHISIFSLERVLYMSFPEQVYTDDNTAFKNMSVTFFPDLKTNFFSVFLTFPLQTFINTIRPCLRRSSHYAIIMVQFHGKCNPTVGGKV